MAKPLTKAERAAAIALLEDATPRPWHAHRDCVVAAPGPRSAGDPDVLRYYGGDLVAESMGQRDRDLFAQVPELLERYEATVQQLERALAELGVAIR